MNYLSVCSGIEAASVAWHPLGWNPIAFSEIEKFPAQVLTHHYPNTPNWGDMTKFKEWPDADVNVLVGGTPCQSFSVAGLRKGLDDPRGNLMLTYLAIADRYRPEWVVWENVPGVLSSNGGRDFASFLRGLAELEYGFAYRILDAQYFGVPQRRRRVFVVGHLGSWQRAAAVLFERHSLQGHPAPSREAGKRVAATVSGGPPYSRTGNERNEVDALCMSTEQAGAEIGIGIGTTLNCNHEAPIVTQNFLPQLVRIHGVEGVSPTLSSEEGRGHGVPTIAFAQNQRDEVRMMEVAGAPASEPGMKQQKFVATEFVHQAGGAQTTLGYDQERGTAPTLSKCQTPAVVAAFKGGQGSGAGSIGYSEHVAPTLPSSDGGNRTPTLMQAMQVRRLTPRECERLQGFKDDFTLIPVRGKPAADGPRYKALGNSMAVPVMAWIGKRIQQVEDISCTTKQKYHSA